MLFISVLILVNLRCRWDKRSHTSRQKITFKCTFHFRTRNSQECSKLKQQQRRRRRKIRRRRNSSTMYICQRHCSEHNGSEKISTRENRVCSVETATTKQSRIHANPAIIEVTVQTVLPKHMKQCREKRNERERKENEANKKHNKKSRRQEKNLN